MSINLAAGIARKRADLKEVRFRVDCRSIEAGIVSVLSFESNESNVSQIKRGLGKSNDPPV
jgi:hypothetical protein